MVLHAEGTHFHAEQRTAPHERSRARGRVRRGREGGRQAGAQLRHQEEKGFDSRGTDKGEQGEKGVHHVHKGLFLKIPGPDVRTAHKQGGEGHGRRVAGLQPHSQELRSGTGAERQGQELQGTAHGHRTGQVMAKDDSITYKQRARSKVF